jgi:hypothetical protein
VTFDVPLAKEATAKPRAPKAETKAPVKGAVANGRARPAAIARLSPRGMG